MRDISTTETKTYKTNHVTCDAQVVYACNIFVLDQSKCDKNDNHILSTIQRLSFDNRLQSMIV